MKKQTYLLKCTCRNCGKMADIEIEKGIQVREIGFGESRTIIIEDEKREIPSCPSCGCGTLVKAYQE